MSGVAATSLHVKSRCVLTVRAAERELGLLV